MLVLRLQVASKSIASMEIQCQISRGGFASQHVGSGTPTQAKEQQLEARKCPEPDGQHS